MSFPLGAKAGSAPSEHPDFHATRSDMLRAGVAVLKGMPKDQLVVGLKSFIHIPRE